MLAFDDRTFGDEPVWLKPFKFAVSFVVLFATLGLLTRRLSTAWRTGWIIVAGAAAAAVALAFEMAYIAAQAGRGEASHFNDSTPFHEAMYAFMGTGAAAIMVVIAIVGLAAWADRDARLAPGLRLGVSLGFLLTALLTTLVAGELAGNDGRYVGMPSVGHARLPVLGWSMEVGDLRPAHFLALHAMQVLPVAGHLVDRFQAPLQIVWILAGLHAVFTLLVFLQALRGIPLIGA